MTFYDNALEAPEDLIRRGVVDRQHLQRTETEDFLRTVSLDYPERQAAYWARDYSSVEAFMASVELNRRRWLEAVGDFGPGVEDLSPEIEPFMEDERICAQWISVRLFDRLRGRGVLAWPKDRSGPLPLVICQHGIGSSPERVFGFDDPSEIYHSYGRRLVQEGFAVLAPLNVTEGPPRGRYTRMALMLGKTLWGLEIFKIRRLLDYVLTLDRIAADRIGMWGISLGGAYTMFTMPLELRIVAGVICAWFNDRIRKMIVDDPRYSCFLSTQEEHIFIPGWLREFSDSDLISLICPRPVLVQTGKGDGIAWWPFAMEAFERSKEHYARLGISDRIEMDLHEGGHEIRYASGRDFLKRRLCG